MFAVGVNIPVSGPVIISVFELVQVKVDFNYPFPSRRRRGEMRVRGIRQGSKHSDVAVRQHGSVSFFYLKPFVLLLLFFWGFRIF